MQTVEFKTQPHNCMIKLPSQFLKWNKSMWVILLIEEADSAIQVAKDLASTNSLLKPSQTVDDSKTFDEPTGLGKLENLKD